MVGVFDDATGFIPSHHYGAEARLPWFDAGGGLTAHSTDAELAARVRGGS